MNRNYADMRNAVPVPESAPAEFRTRISDIRAGKKLQRRKPVAVAQSTDTASEAELLAVRRKIQKAKLATLL